MRTRCRKRLLSLLLAIVMVVSLFPLDTAFAYYNFSLSGASNDSDDGDWEVYTNNVWTAEDGWLNGWRHYHNGASYSSSIAFMEYAESIIATETKEGRIRGRCDSGGWTWFSVLIPPVTSDLYTLDISHPTYYGTGSSMQAVPVANKTIPIQIWGSSYDDYEERASLIVPQGKVVGLFGAGLWNYTHVKSTTAQLVDERGRRSDIAPDEDPVIAQITMPWYSSGSYFEIKPYPTSFSNLKTLALTGQSKTILSSTAGTNAITGDLAKITFAGFDDDSSAIPRPAKTLSPTIYVHDVAGVSGNTLTATKYANDRTGATKLSSVTEPGLYWVSLILKEKITKAGYWSNYQIQTKNAAAENVTTETLSNLGQTRTTNMGEEYVLYMRPSSFGTYYVDDSPTAALNISPNSNRFNFYSSTSNWTSTAGTKSIQLYTNLKSGPASSGYALDKANVTVNKYTIDRCDPVTAANPNPRRNTAFADLGLPTTTKIYGQVPSGRASAPEMSGIPIVWDESTWDPTNTNPQTITGTLNIAAVSEANRIFTNANNVKVSVQITPQTTMPSSVSFPNKTVEYTGSPISHEVDSVTGALSTSYSYEGINGTAYGPTATAPTDIGEYQVTATFEQDPDYEPLAPATSVLTITKQTQTVPADIKPELDSATPISITLLPAPGDGPWEYGIIRNGIPYFQSELTFDGLTPNTKYSFVLRLAETATGKPSEPSAQSDFNTPAGTITATITVDNPVVTYGTPVNLSADTSHDMGGNAVLTYQWYKNGTPLEGQTSKDLRLTDITDSGSYYYRVTVQVGSYTIYNISNTLAVQINESPIAPGLLPENWTDYLITDPITYGETLGDTHIRLDVDRLVADGYPQAGEVTVSFHEPDEVPSVKSSQEGTGFYDVTLTASVPNIISSQDVQIKETDIIVNPAPLIIKIKDLSITFGDNPERPYLPYEYEVTGLVNGDTDSFYYDNFTFTCDYSKQWQPVPESGTAIMSVSGLSKPNYDVELQPGILTINKYELDLSLKAGTIGDGKKVYGKTDPSPLKQFTVDLPYNMPAVFRTEATNLINNFPITREPGENVGFYPYIYNDKDPAVAESTNFKIKVTLPEEEHAGEFEITKRPAEALWQIPYPLFADGTDKSGSIKASYTGADGRPIELSVSIWKNETETAMTEPGTYLARAEDTSTGKDNYELFGMEKEVVLVEPGSTTNVSFPTASDIQYRQKLKDSTLTGGNGGTTGKGTYQWANPEDAPGIGTHTKNVIFTPSPDDKTDYSSEVGWDAATNTITRPVTIKVTPIKAVSDSGIEVINTKTYDGTPNAAITAADVINIQPDDDVTLTISATYDDKNAGTDKVISVSFKLSGRDADKYIVPEDYQVPGTIVPAPLKITAKDASVQYGDPLGNTGYVTEGFITGETATVLDGSASYDYAGYQQWDPVPDGSKNISVSGFTARNYAISYLPGALTVTRRIITVDPEAGQSKLYGDAEPEYRFAVNTGLTEVPAGVQAELDANPAILTRAEGEDAGSYPFQCTTPDTNNFTWQVSPGAVFTIRKRPVTIEWEGADVPYFENGTDQSSAITAKYQQPDGSYSQMEIIIEKDGLKVPFTTPGTYRFYIRPELFPNYEFTNTEKYIRMGSESDRNSLVFPYATPILKGETLRESNLVNGIGDGSFSWVDDTIQPEQSGSYPVTFAPTPGNDVSDQPGYDPETGLITRNVGIEVWDAPLDLPPDDPTIWAELKNDGWLDKLYDGTDASLLTGKVPTLVRDASGMWAAQNTTPADADLRNVNHELNVNGFYQTICGDKTNAVFQMLGNNLVKIDINGRYDNKDTGADKPLTLQFAVSGPCARLFRAGKKDTTGNISFVKLLTAANDETITVPGEMPKGNGVTFPESTPTGYTMEWEQPGETWRYGLRGGDTISAMGGTLNYRFVGFKEDGTEVEYSPRELYAAPIYVIPEGLTSTNYELHYLAGRLSAPNIHTDEPDFDGKRPAPPTMKENSTTTITLNPIVLGQYSLDGGRTWQDSTDFSGLTPNTPYQAKQRVPDPKNPGDYLISDPAELKTRDPNANPNRPNPPQIKDKTDTTVEVVPIPNGQYSIDGGKTWQDSPVFPGLIPDTTYDVIQRIPDPEAPSQWLVSDPTRVKTDPTPEDPNKNKPTKPIIDEVTDTSISVKPIPNGEYSIDGGKTWQPSPIFPGLKPDTAYDVIQRIPNPEKPDEYLVSDSTQVKTKPAPGTVAKPSIKDVTDTTIEVNPIPGGEYSIDGGKTWQNSPIFDGLTPGTDYEVIQRIPDPNHPGDYIVSEPIEVTTDDETPELPDPEAVSRTDTTILLKPIPYGEYSNDRGKTWQSSPAFTGLTPNTTYDVVQRVPSNGDYALSKHVPIQTYPSITVPKPEITGSTPDSITLKPIEDGEYSKDNGRTWQPGPYFSGLTPNTTYTFLQRVPGYGGSYVISEPTQGTTPKQNDPVAPDYTIHYPDKTIDYDNTKWDAFEDPACTRPIPSGGSITPGSTIYFKDKETGNVVPVQIPKQPNPPVLDKTDESVSGANDGSIYPTTTNMEYSTDDGNTWLPCPDGALRGLAPGIYLVRYKATGSSFASEPTVVVINKGISQTVTPPVDDNKHYHFVQPGRPNGYKPNGTGDSGGSTTIILDNEVALGGLSICPSDQYVDVDQTQWYHDAVDFTVANRLMVGFGPAQWGPERVLTRFQALQVLYRLAGSPQGYSLSNIEDIPDNLWAYNAIAWAYNTGITRGLTHTTFGPDEAITYEQLADMLYKFCQLSDLPFLTGNAATEYDRSFVSEQYQAAVTAMAAMGICNVHGSTSINPQSTMSRCVGAQVVTNFCTLYRQQLLNAPALNSQLPALYTNPGTMNTNGTRYS